MRHLGIALIISAGLFTACSSDEQAEEGLENDISQNSGNNEQSQSNEGGENSDNSENAAGSSENSDESNENSASDETSEAEVAAEDTSAAVEPPAPEMPEPPAVEPPPPPPPAPTAALPIESAPAPAAAATATPPPSLWDPNRHVRFIKVDGTPIYASAQVGGQTVGTLRKGDHVMVLLQGEWGMVSDSAYIQSSALSDKAIPRVFSQANWIPASE